MAKQGFNGELLHINAVRARVLGSGNLDIKLNSVEEINTVTLAPIIMATSTNREPTVLANFVDQLIQIEFSVNEIDEYFTVTKLVLFYKPVATGYPI